MYAYIIGKVTYASLGAVVLENNGIGYQIFCSAKTVAAISGAKEAKLHTYLHVKEDAFVLYGFLTEEERAIFMKLISISGIGPKMSLQILSGMDEKTLAISIVTGDSKALSKIKGVGKKTAERIILELRESINAEQTEAMEAEGKSADSGRCEPLSEVEKDTISLLQSLGVPKAKAEKAVATAIKEASSLEDVARLALKNL